MATFQILKTLTKIFFEYLDDISKLIKINNPLDMSNLINFCFIKPLINM